MGRSNAGSVEGFNWQPNGGGSGFRQDGGRDGSENPGGGRGSPGGGPVLEVTRELAERFLAWLDLPGDSKQLREYRRNVERLIGARLDCQSLHEYASQSKRKYETLSRLLSFIASRRGLGDKRLAEELRECLGRKPRTGSDTYVPPDSLVVEAAGRLAGSPAYHAFLLLLGSGARLSTIYHVLAGGVDESRLACMPDRGYCRYHVDYVRGEKLQWALYAPIDWWRYALEAGGVGLSYSRLQKLITQAGVKAKHLRNWVYNKMLALGIPEAAVEFIVGHRPDTVGRRHYLNALALADAFYGKYAAYVTRLGIPLPKRANA